MWSTVSIYIITLKLTSFSSSIVAANYIAIEQQSGRSKQRKRKYLKIDVLAKSPISHEHTKGNNQRQAIQDWEPFSVNPETHKKLWIRFHVLVPNVNKPLTDISGKHPRWVASANKENEQKSDLNAVGTKQRE